MVGRGPAGGAPAASRGQQLDAQQEPQIWTGENIVVGLADTMLERENDCSIRIRVNYTYIYIGKRLDLSPHIGPNPANTHSPSP
jgi:hypothetical protein